MERINLYDNEASIDGVDVGPTTQAQHRAAKREFYQSQRPLGVSRMPEVVIDQIEETEPTQQEGE